MLERLEKANRLQKKGKEANSKHSDSTHFVVVASREAAIDSEHIKLLSEIARGRAQSSRGELVEFDSVVYCEKLVSVSLISVYISVPIADNIHGWRED